jgi:urease accessory protein
MPLRPLRLAAASVAGAALGGVPAAALAHHAMDGAAPATLWQGFASGLAHPVIGPDHLAFVIAAGVLAAGAGRRAGTLALAAFVAAGPAGSAMHLAGIGPGPVEALVALSTLLVGVALLLARPPVRGLPLVAAFGVAGVLHGNAYAEAAIGVEPGPVGAYLVGLAATQAALAFAAWAVARRFEAAAPGQAASLPRRAAGSAAAAVGGVAALLAVLSA